jgi:hypothetical protein
MANANQNSKPWNGSHNIANSSQSLKSHSSMSTFTLKIATNVFHRHQNNLSFFSNSISHRRRSRLVPTVSMLAATNVQTFLEKSAPSTLNTALPIMVWWLIHFWVYVSMLKWWNEINWFDFIVHCSRNTGLDYELFVKRELFVYSA